MAHLKGVCLNTLKNFYLGVSVTVVTVCGQSKQIISMNMHPNSHFVVFFELYRPRFIIVCES